METKRCIFCMQEMPTEEKKCPACGKGPWQYQWKPGWIQPYTILYDRYLIGTALGEGAFGVTYLAWDEKAGEKAAIKAYKKETPGREAEFFEAAGEIPGLVKKKEVFREDGREYLALEYLEGGSLKEYLKNHRTIPASEAKDLLLPAMKAAAGLHSKGIVHCDISPDNLLFAADGKLSLIDLGAAARKGGVRTEKELKPGYAPMELYQEKEKIGPWTDIYAFCAVWYEMVTGRKAPAAPDRMKKDTLKPPSEYVRVPAGMEEVFLRGLSLEIQRRYFSMGNLWKELDIAGEPAGLSDEEVRREWGDLWIRITTSVERISVPGGRTGKARRRLRTAALVCLGLISTAVLLGGGLFVYVRTHPENVLEFSLEQDRERIKTEEIREVRTRDSEEYGRAVSFLEENAYLVNRYDYSDAYHLLSAAMNGWEYGNSARAVFPVQMETMERAVQVYMGVETERTEDTTGYVIVYHRDWYPIEEYMNRHVTLRYGETSIQIYSDYVTGWVTEISLLGEQDMAVTFLRKMLQTACRETYLTEKEIEEILTAVQKTEDYQSISLNAKCSLFVGSYDGKISVSISP